MMSKAEAWLRGPVAGVADELQPVAHALIQADEDLTRLLDGVPTEVLWARPGSAASAGYHVQHLVGSLERLFTYARGEQLSKEQFDALKKEASPDGTVTATELLAHARRAVALALRQVRATDPATLGETREVGRARLPATVRGLLFHAAEHTTRHAGQVSTTLKVLGAGT
jgi:uncharacterized damage-inducible protein DinB